MPETVKIEPMDQTGDSGHLKRSACAENNSEIPEKRKTLG